MSDRVNHRRLGRQQRSRVYRPRLDRNEGFKHASSFAYPVDTDDEPETKRRLDELLGAQS